MTDTFYVSLRQRAIRDADNAFDHLRTEGPPRIAENFVDDLGRAFSLLAGHQLTGSLRFAFELDIPDLFL